MIGELRQIWQELDVCTHCKSLCIQTSNKHKPECELQFEVI